MKIGIDARMLDWAGVGRYSRELMKGLAEIDKENEYILFCNPENEHPVPQAANFVKRPSTCLFFRWLVRSPGLVY